MEGVCLLFTHLKQHTGYIWLVPQEEKGLGLLPDGSF